MIMITTIAGRHQIKSIQNERYIIYNIKNLDQKSSFWSNSRSRLEVGIK